jgi:hypothetical protein
MRMASARRRMVVAAVAALVGVVAGVLALVDRAHPAWKVVAAAGAVVAVAAACRVVVRGVPMGREWPRR